LFRLFWAFSAFSISVVISLIATSARCTLFLAASMALESKDLPIVPCMSFIADRVRLIELVTLFNTGVIESIILSVDVTVAIGSPPFAQEKNRLKRRLDCLIRYFSVKLSAPSFVYTVIISPAL